jgi:D-sedoheptulose 7-phosphate isomerase
MNIHRFIDKYLTEVMEGLDALDWDWIENAIHTLEGIRKKNGRVYLIGNGGSATLAEHMATDLQLAGVKAQSLTGIADVTTHANDSAFHQCFVNQLKILNDCSLLICISGSGNSPSILRAAEWARDGGVDCIGLTGFDGGELANLCNIHLHIHTQHMGMSQDGQQVILHLICYWLMENR